MEAEKVDTTTKSGHGGRREGSGRKPGVPNKATREIREFAQAYGQDAILRAAELAGLILDEETGQPKGKATSEQAQIAALGIVLDRAYGKPTQPIAGEGGGPIVHQVSRIELVAEPVPDRPD